MRYATNVYALLLAACIALAASPVAAARAISAAQARNHVGEVETVCGTVASAKYAARSRGHPTFLNLDRPYPRQVFTALIWGSDRSKFDRPESTYLGRKICVTGEIRAYRGSPEIVVRDPARIRVQ